MSIRQAIANASKEALGSYLAPELVEQLSEEIVLRVAAELETTINAFTGFDLARPSPARALTRKVPAGRRPRRALADDDTAKKGHQASGTRGGEPSHNEQEPSPEHMV